MRRHSDEHGKNEIKRNGAYALKTMNDEELCRIFNCFFRRLGTFDSVNSMACFDDDFNVNDTFYAYSAWDTISSFNWVKESNFFKDNVDNVIDEVVENWDALGRS